jgi:hypothetical protein
MAHVSTKIVDALPIEDVEIIEYRAFGDHRAYTEQQLIFDCRGWHEEVYTQEQFGGNNMEECFSNTPKMGVGNSYYNEVDFFYQDLEAAVDLYDKEGSTDETDTCLFWRKLPNGKWIIYEVWGDITDG